MTHWQRLDRFLVLGTEGSSTSAGEQRFTIADAQNALSLVRTEGLRFVELVVKTSKSGRATRDDATIFALALAAAFGSTETRQAAFGSLPSVCRTGTQLFQFVSEAERLRGWGRGMRKAVAHWYSRSEVDELTHQALRHQQRSGWSHRDLLRLAHPKPPTEAHRVLFKWIVDGELTGDNPRIEAFEQLKSLGSQSRTQANKSGGHAKPESLVRQYRLNRDCVPPALLNRPEVWEALLEDMTLSAMVQNLGNMTRCGLLTPGSRATHHVVGRLSNDTLLRRAGVHPLTILIAQALYTRGQGTRDQSQVAAVPEIVDALDDAFHLAFQAVGPADKRLVVGVDVSGSMSSSMVANSPLSACEAATAMTLVYLATEPQVMPMVFADRFRRLPLFPTTRLTDALKLTQSMAYGGPDCALPMTWAMKNKIEADVFVVLTDTDPGFGRVSPAQALRDYRQKTGVAAKLAVVGMCAGSFLIADPNDPGMLDIVGFDSSVPAILREFAVS